MSYSDFPLIPEVMGNKSHDSRRFPIHTEVRAWLGVFATHYDLWPHIHLSTQVTSLQPLAIAGRNSNNGASEQPAAPQWRLRHKPLQSKHPQAAASAPQNGTASVLLASGSITPHTSQNGTSASANSIADADHLAPHHAHITAAAKGVQKALPDSTGHAYAPQAQEQDYETAAASGFANAKLATAAPANGHSSSELCEAAASARTQQPDTAATPASDAPSNDHSRVPSHTQDPPTLGHQPAAVAAQASHAHSNGHSRSYTHAQDAHTDFQQLDSTLVPEPAAAGPGSAAQVHDDSSSGQQEQEQVFDAVVSCIGNYHEPNLPDVAGMDDFPGFQMHAHNYRTNAMFASKRVIVVGSSVSGESTHAPQRSLSQVYACTISCLCSAQQLSRPALLTQAP